MEAETMLERDPYEEIRKDAERRLEDSGMDQGTIDIAMQRVDIILGSIKDADKGIQPSRNQFANIEDNYRDLGVEIGPLREAIDSANPY